jgi:alpha/beta superfamily hydrolase
MSLDTEQALYIAGPAGLLESMWWPSVSGPTKAAVICHPHPLKGGSMNNKVVTTLARTWRDAGFSTLRFNFRGVGSSAGEYADGEGEINDLLAAVQWLVAVQGVREITLAGFSFGAWISAAGVQYLPATVVLKQLVLVAPPVQYPGFDTLQPPATTLVIQGEIDDVVEPEAVYAWAASRLHPPELRRFPGAGHFFHGRLTELKAVLATRL